MQTVCNVTEDGVVEAFEYSWGSGPYLLLQRFSSLTNREEHGRSVVLRVWTMTP